MSKHKVKRAIFCFEISRPQQTALRKLPLEVQRFFSEAMRQAFDRALQEAQQK